MQVEDLEALLNGRIIEAYSLGMSVVEITRVLRKNSIEYVHSLLRETGNIPAMARSEYRRSYDINCRLEAALRKKGYSFGRWCLGWKLDPGVAEAVLKTLPETSEQSGPHEAMRHDFPDLYFKIFGGSPPRKKRKVGATPFYPSVIITWDFNRNGYVAKIVEKPGIEAIGGFDWEQALERLKTVYRFHVHINRLNDAIDLIGKG